MGTIETVDLATLLRMNRPEPAQADVRDNVRAWVKHFMEDIPLETHQAFADAIGVERETVTNVLNGKRFPGLKFLYKMHFHLGMQSGVTLEQMIYRRPREIQASKPAARAQ